MNGTAVRHLTVKPVHNYSYDIFDHVYIYDRRYMPRWEITSRAFYRDNIHHLLVRTQMRDLTPAGVCLYADKSIEVNQRLEVKMFLSPEKSFQAWGSVMWKKSCNGQTLAGVVFDELENRLKNLILENGFVSACSIG
ncbi:MAG: PilZ domain-containing protein [Candidatus Omnitrophota bacterium]